ncbi:hypothetical protein Tco_0168140 [Tanacetum coccineum]
MVRWERNTEYDGPGNGTMVFGDEQGSMMGRGTGQWGVGERNTSPSNQAQTRVVVQTLKETIRRLQEDNAQMRSRFERDMQVQLQREVERQVQEHTQQRELEANAREQTRDREWQQREFDVLLSDTPVGIRSSVRMEEVIVSAPVQECLDMEVDKVEGDAKLTEHKKPNRRKKRRSKNKLLAKGEDTENPNTSVGAIASADQEMIMQSPAAETASHDILTLTATVDEQMTVLSPAPVQECLVMETDKDEVAAQLTKTQKKNRKRYLKKKANKGLESLGKREGTDNPGSLGAIASVDLKMMVLSPAATVDENSSIPSTNATDQIASGDSLSTKVHDAVSGEMGLGKTVSDSTTSKKRKRNQRAKKKVAGDVLSAKVNEVSGETVPSKTTAINTTLKKKRNKKKRKLKTVAGDILSTCENIQSKVNAIDGSSATEVTEAISGDWDHLLKKKSPLSGDILNTDWNPWPKGADILNTDWDEWPKGANIVSKGANILNTNWDHLLKKKSPLSGDILNTDWNPWPKGADILNTELSKKKSPLSGDILRTDWNPWPKKKSQLSDDILNTDWKCGKNMVAELGEKGIHMNEEKFGTYKSTDGYAREYDIAGSKGKECGWIYE